MLSRVADSLYWLSRYIERAENLARLVDVNRKFSLDARNLGLGFQDPWSGVLQATCSEEAYDEACRNSEQPVDAGRFISLALENPESIRGCIATARENARMVRDQIPDEMWLELNRIHLYLQNEAGADWAYDPLTFYRKVIDFSLLFQGLTDATILNDEGWRFIQIGKFIERADKTSRILDMLTFGPEADRYRCGSILRTCSSEAAFRQEFRGEVTLENVATFLLFSETFPRSVRFCLRRLDSILRSITGAAEGAFSNEAERLTGSVVAQVNFATINEVLSTGLHQYIDQLQTKINDMGQLIFETYVLLPQEIEGVTRSEGIHLQWQQQQQ